jgi:hypothetical protein
MRKAALTGLVFVACVVATNAQFSVTPKVGMEQSFTSVQYNNMGSLCPLGSDMSPQAALRMDYLFKKSHGPFLGVSTNRSLIAYQFTNPETGDKEYTASRGDWQMRVEAGYQLSSKPIAIGKSSKQTTTKPASSVQSPCAAKLIKAVANAAKKSDLNVRIQPYAGMAFIPNPETAISGINKESETVYQYKAGNWTSAFISGVQFAFAKGDVRKFVLGLQYLKGIGNLNTETLNTALDNKQTITHLSSSASAWNFTVGMPISFTKNKTAVKPANNRYATAGAGTGSCEENMYLL